MAKKQTIRLTESQLHNIIRESIKDILREEINSDDYAPWEDPNTWITPTETLRGMGYDENGMRRGKKYYDHLLNPDWRFNQDKGYDRYDDILSNYPDEQYISDLDDLEIGRNRQKAQSEKNDAKWQKSADSRPLHRRGSLNRDLK